MGTPGTCSRAATAPWWCDEIGQLLTVIRYIARNPVEAGLCDEPEQWPWASHAAVVGGTAPRWLDTTRLLAYFGADGGEPMQRYVAFVR